MTILKNIPRLPIELKYYIYRYLDIDTRIELITHIHPQNKFIEYFNAIPTEDNVKLFKVFIQNQLLIFKQSPNSTWKTWYLKPDIANLLPNITYEHNHRTHNIQHNICSIIANKSHLHYIPSASGLYVPRNLKHKRYAYVLGQVRSIYSIFSSISGCSQNFIYILKKTLLYYMIAIIINGKENAIATRNKIYHNIKKIWLKRDLPRPLKRAVKLYDKRVKIRIIENNKITMKKAREDAKRAKQKVKEDAKNAKKQAREDAKREKLNKPKIVIIKRKKA